MSWSEITQSKKRKFDNTKSNFSMRQAALQSPKYWSESSATNYDCVFTRSLRLTKSFEYDIRSEGGKQHFLRSISVYLKLTLTHTLKLVHSRVVEVHHLSFFK